MLLCLPIVLAHNWPHHAAFPHGVERPRLPVNREGWFATGDIGEIDGDGYLTVRGRKDNMFISGGENIHPEEIEAILCQLPDIIQAVVVAMPDEEFGHRPVAFLDTQGETIDPSALTRTLENALPRYKIPIAYYPLSESRHAAGLKLNRDDLKNLALLQLNRPR